MLKEQSSTGMTSIHYKDVGNFPVAGQMCG